MSNHPIFVQERDTWPTIQDSGAVTGPPAPNTVIGTITIDRSGMWEVIIERFLGGTSPGTSDIINMQLLRNSTVVLSPLIVPGVASGALFEDVFLIKCTVGDVISVTTIAAGTASVIYYVTIIARLTYSNVGALTRDP